MIRLLIALLILSAPVAAQDAASAARLAADRLEQASVQMQQAKSAKNRVKAMTEALRAYEDGLSAMRDGLRKASIQESKIRRELDARYEEISKLLGVLQTLSASPAPVTMVHPDGPIGTARSGMILADITPALNQRAESLRQKLEDVTALRELQQNAAQTLESGLKGIQEARTELSKAISDRVDLPRRFTEDATKTALLIASTETLHGFASGLSAIAENEADGSLPDISHRRGELPYPVNGTLLRQSGEPDAAGITRPGIIMATRPRALVTTPAAVTVRYQGPLLDYGTVSILEPQSGLLIILAGLESVFGNTGEVLPAGSPVGMMGGKETDFSEILTQSSEGTGIERSETLYIEIRENNEPVDPLTWFGMQKD